MILIAFINRQRHLFLSIILEGVGVELESLAILCWFSEHYFFLTAHNAEYRSRASHYCTGHICHILGVSKFHNNHCINCAVVTLKKGNLSVSFYLPGDLTHQSRREDISQKKLFCLIRQWRNMSRNLTRNDNDDAKESIS